MFYILYAEPSI